MKPVLILALLLQACSGCECETKCGLRFSRVSCEYAQRTEDLAISYFQTTKDERLHACEGKLRGYNVEQAATRNFVDLGELVSGRTYCGLRVMKINAGLTNKTSLAHEMAHALQECRARDQEGADDPDHAHWEEDGIFAAIDAVKGENL